MKTSSKDKIIKLKKYKYKPRIETLSERIHNSFLNLNNLYNTSNYFNTETKNEIVNPFIDDINSIINELNSIKKESNFDVNSLINEVNLLAQRSLIELSLEKYKLQLKYNYLKIKYDEQLNEISKLMSENKIHKERINELLKRDNQSTKIILSLKEQINHYKKYCTKPKESSINSNETNNIANRIFSDNEPNIEKPLNIVNMKNNDENNKNKIPIIMKFDKINFEIRNDFTSRESKKIIHDSSIDCESRNILYGNNRYKIAKNSNNLDISTYFLSNNKSKKLTPLKFKNNIYFNKKNYNENTNIFKRSSSTIFSNRY